MSIGTLARALASAAVIFFVLPAWAGAPPASLPPGFIGIRNFPFDISKGEPIVPQALRGRGRPQGRPGYYIIKFRDKDNQDARKRLAARGIRFQGYIPVDAFLAKVPPGRVGEAASDTDVSAVFDYRPAYRLQGRLLDAVTKGGTGQKTLVVQVFDGEDIRPIEKAVEGLGGTYKVILDGPGLNEKKLEVTLDASVLADLASVDGVLWIEEAETAALHNDRACTVMGSDHVWGLYTSLRGTGQVVAVCDTGLDTGDTSTVHPDFAGTTSDGHAKIKQTFAYGRTNNWSDTDGHGTHTCGSVLGAGVKSAQLQAGTFARGTAWDAQLVMQSVLTASGNLNIPNLNATTFPDAYEAGARVHSNSWGFLSSAGQYTSSAADADTYVWNHKDFLPVFSAGNDGADANADGVIDLGSVSSPSTAKNVICVGAMENDRTNIGTKYGTAMPNSGFVEPIFSDKMADNPGGMAAFSSRGPCQDGRIKPDLDAPGTYVLSTRSSQGNSVGYVNASKYGYPTSFNTYYAFLSGTSMAAPLTAGAAALVRQYLQKSGLSDPSAALIKCMLINGATDAPGQYASPRGDVTGRPDMNQGWGRVNLQDALYPSAPGARYYADNTSGLNTGGSASYQYGVSDTTVPLRVNLVWSDYPGMSLAQYELVNDLDLAVVAPDGREYHGNRYSGSYSIANDPDYDRRNNVEGVTIPASSMTLGTVNVRVQAYTVPHGPQPYALVISGGVTDQVDTVPPSAVEWAAASPGNASIGLVWKPAPDTDVWSYRVIYNSYSTMAGNVTSKKLTGLTNGVNYSLKVRAVDYSRNAGPATAPVNATPMAPVSELPHYNWDGSPAWSCGSCHLSPGRFLPAGYDYGYEQSLCMSCHNPASVGHGRTVSRKTSHSLLVNVTTGGNKRPAYGTVTSGEYSDAMYTHLKGGRLIVCATCHNAMRKPDDAGRSWETLGASPDGRTFRPPYGGWWDQGHADVKVYRDGTLWTPTYSKARASLKIDSGSYVFDEYSAKVTFINRTSGYVYLNLDDAYLRAPGRDNTICLDCHSQATHRSLSCTVCHAAHGTDNVKGIRKTVRKPAGVYRDAVFLGYTGLNSFADGGTTRDGICEVCHTATLYYRYDGTGAATHLDGQDYDRKDCTTCHPHVNGFSRL